MTSEEQKRLEQMKDACEVRHRSGWYLLADEGTAWLAVGGPYNTREEARTARRDAFDQWWAMPWESRHPGSVAGVNEDNGGSNDGGFMEEGVRFEEMENDVKPRFRVLLEREITAWLVQQVAVEVEARDDEEAERKAIQGVEDDDFNESQWEIVDGEVISIEKPTFADNVERQA